MYRRRRRRRAFNQQCNDATERSVVISNKRFSHLLLLLGKKRKRKKVTHSLGLDPGNKLLVQHGLDQGGNPFISGEQDAAGQHGPAESHGAAPPQASDAVVVDDALQGLGDARALDTLGTRLERVKGLRDEDDDGAGDGAIGERGGRGLLDVAQPLKVLEDVVRAQPHGRGARLFECRGDVPAVQGGPQAVLGDEGACGMQRRREPPVVARVVDQRRLDALRRRDGEGARHHARRDARHQVAQRRERAGLGVLEGTLDAVERDEPDGVLEHRARHERLASLVQRPRAFLFDHRLDHAEGVARRAVFV